MQTRQSILKNLSLLSLVLIIFPVFIAVEARAETSVLTYLLQEDKVNYQFIITGETEDFEVDLVLQDGTRIVHDQPLNEEMQDYLYIGYENERIWVVRNAPAGEYRFEISYASEQTFRISTKDPIRKLETTWQEPSGRQITVRDQTAIPLAWSVSGDARPYTDQIHVWLEPASGGKAVHVQSFGLTEEEAELLLPAAFPEGEYRLLLAADTRAQDIQQIDPDVTVIVDWSKPGSAVTLVDSFLQNQVLYVDLAIPNELRWDELTAGFAADGAWETWEEQLAQVEPAAPLSSEIAAASDDLERLEETETDVPVYRWAVSEFTDEGIFEGLLQLKHQGKLLTVVQVPSFEVRLRDWGKDRIEWSIEAERTNRRHVELSLLLQDEAHLQIVTEQEMLHEQEVPMADGDVPYRLRVPLSEGDQLLQLIFQDKYGNFYTTAKRYVVDLTPPRLEMIQPLPKHQTALDGYASGFVEAGARLVVNGMEVEPDGEGYFRVENIGASLEIEVSDAAGNSTHYAWEQERGSSPVIWIVLLNAGLIAIAGCAIWWIRKKWGTSTEA